MTIDAVKCQIYVHLAKYTRYKTGVSQYDHYDVKMRGISFLFVRTNGRDDAILMVYA